MADPDFFAGAATMDDPMAGASRDAVRELLRGIFQAHDPGRLPSVDSLLHHSRGFEESLYLANL